LLSNKKGCQLAAFSIERNALTRVSFCIFSTDQRDCECDRCRHNDHTPGHDTVDKSHEAAQAALTIDLLRLAISS